MQYFPHNFGCVHFVGIGGIGMSGIAEILHNLGYVVQGSDASDNANVARLRKIGINVSIGHQAAHVGDAKVVVISSAVKDTNPEVAEARAKKIPVIKRAEMLAELMRYKWTVAVAGSHGKTTTTSMVSTLFEHGGYDPTVINGGVINSYGSNARLGTGRWMVVESDESDGSFLTLPSTVGIVTNIDPEHLEHYGSFDKLKDAFVTFLQNLPFYGYGVACIDHPVVVEIIAKVKDRKIITYGRDKNADVHLKHMVAENGYMLFSVSFKNEPQNMPKNLESLMLPMLGEHNVMNAIAAIAVAAEMGMSEQSLRDGLARFSGVKRRFTKTGVVAERTIIDDYAHHPVEIQAVLKTARLATKNKILAVFQPHRYSRASALMDDFGASFENADTIIVSDIYSAGEEPIAGVNQQTMIDAIAKNNPGKKIIALSSEDELPALVAANSGPGDYVVCLGAGTVTYWAQNLPTQLAPFVLNVEPMAAVK